MDIDAHNAQINEINDAKIQQIKAQRKLFGGIIKKGDPLYKNIINVILFTLLFPCMIIFGLVIGIKNFSISIWESLISFIGFIVRTSIRTKQYIIVNYYFVSNWIYKKGSLLIRKLRDGIKVCSEYIAQKCQYVKLVITYYSQIFIENYLIILYKWMANKFKVLIGICAFWFRRLSNYIKKLFQKLMGFAIVQYKFIIFKAKQMILIIDNAIKRLIIYLKEKIKQLISYLQQKIKKGFALFHEHVYIQMRIIIIFLSFYLFIKACQGMIKLQNSLNYYVPLIQNYLKVKYQQIKDWIHDQIQLLRRCIKYLKNRIIHFSLLFIDYILGKYFQLQQNVISPFSLKIQEVLKKIKNLIIDLSLKTIDLIKLTLLYLRDNVIIKLKEKLLNYYRNGQKVSYKVYKIIQKRGKMLSEKLKQIYHKYQENRAIRYQKFLQQMHLLQEKIKKISKIISKKIKIICTKIQDIAKYCNSKIKLVYKFIKKLLKLSKQLIKNFIKLVFRTIIKFIKWTIEIQCKIIVQFIIAFRILIPIIWLIEKCFDIIFIIISYPYIQFNKMIDAGIDIFIYKLPNKLYDSIVYLIEKFISLLIKIERFIEIIIKQSKKIITIINQKFIQPISTFIKWCYNIIKKVVLTIVQSLINFKDMIKYNYILPAWASIRLFGVKLKNSYIKMKQKVILIINYGIHQLRLAYLFLKDQILFIKTQITNLIILLIQFIKRQIQLLWQQIKFVYGIMIDPLIQFKNYIIQAFLSFKKMISNFLQFLRDIIVAQCIIIKEAIFAILNKMKEILNQIKQSMIEQFQAIKVILFNIYDSLMQSLIQIKIQIGLQMELIKQSLIQQKNTIIELFIIIGQNIKMQGIQVKESIVSLKNDMILAIQMMFKRG